MNRYQKLQEYFKTLFKYRDRNFSDTDHSVKRFNERFPQYNSVIYKKIVAQGIDIILDIFNDSKGKYIFISKSKDVAIQTEWRQDRKFPDDKNHGFSASTLDYTVQKKVIKGDTKLFVEDFKKYDIQKWFEILDYKQIIKEIGYYDIKLEECPDYKLYIKEGSIYKNFEIIEVE